MDCKKKKTGSAQESLRAWRICAKNQSPYLKSIGLPAEAMLWSPRLSLSNFHVKLTAKGLFRNLQLLSGCRKNTVVFHAGLDMILSSVSSCHPTINHFMVLTSSSFHSSVNTRFRPTGQSLQCVTDI